MLFNIFRSQPNIKHDIVRLRDAAARGGIDAAFTRRAKEIESLRQYDRGEKHIVAPDIRSLVRNVRTSR